jgi:maleate isomerase
MFGWRARLGIIYPAPAVVAEPEFFSVLPDSISICTTRVPLLQTTFEGLLKTLEHVLEAGRLLAQARVNIIGFLCTVGSLVKGEKFDKKLSSDIKEATGIKAVTTATSVAEALRFLKAKRIIVATPYTDDINTLEKSFLEDQGFEVLTIEGLGLSDPDAIRDVKPWEVYHLSRKIWRKNADALFVSCTGIETFSIIQALEDDFSKPVITSNQASLWYMLKTIGINICIQEKGRLLKGN